MEFTLYFEKETEEERNAHSLVLCSTIKIHILFNGDMGISEETNLDLAEEMAASSRNIWNIQILKRPTTVPGKDLPVLPLKQCLKSCFISCCKDTLVDIHPGRSMEER